MLIPFFSLLSLAASVRRDTPCPAYDSMHTAGGTIPPCAYVPQIVYNQTIGQDETYAFGVDGSHLNSQGAVAYLKSLYSLSPDQFVACTTPDCSELVGTR
jgi:hypothetical protein